MPAFEDSAIDGKKRVDVRFTAARVAEAEGGLKYEEVWLLTGPEAKDDWNNWEIIGSLQSACCMWGECHGFLLGSCRGGESTYRYNDVREHRLISPLISRKSIDDD